MHDLAKKEYNYHDTSTQQKNTGSSHPLKWAVGLASPSTPVLLEAKHIKGYRLFTQVL